MGGFFSNSTPEISAQAAAARLQETPPPMVVDVREPAEYAQGHIPGSILMPLGTVAARLPELPRDREILVVCRSGSRSGMATRTLVGAGLKAQNVAGGMLAWPGPVTH